MKIYNYHPETKHFICESIADEDPVVEGNFLIPANATTIAPPKFNADSVAVFENDGWRIEAIPVPEKPPEPTPEELQKQENNKNRMFLASTDWYVVRKVETGVEIPQDILDARAAARAAIVE